MSQGKKSILIVLASAVGLLAVAFFILLASDPFFAMQAEGIRKAGTWEDDPKNWHRAFNEETPAGVKVVHSKYWRSSHFTYEFICYFEVEATPEWRDAFLKKRKLQLVSPTTARAFRTNNGSSDIPTWFAPDPDEAYDIWDMPGYFGSVWINKTNGHIYFFDSQI